MRGGKRVPQAKPRRERELPRFFCVCQGFGRWAGARQARRCGMQPRAYESPCFKLGVIFYIIRYISHACVSYDKKEKHKTPENKQLNAGNGIWKRAVLVTIASSAVTSAASTTVPAICTGV